MAEEQETHANGEKEAPKARRRKLIKHTRRILGIFGLFSKKKKETLDQGLEKTKQSVFSKITRAIAGKSKVDSDVLDNLEEVLITSDVGVDTTVKIINRIEERVARDKYVSTSELNKILKEEIASLLKIGRAHV